MGFRPEETTFRLKFADDDLEGLEVVMGSLSVGEYSKMMRLIASSAVGFTEAAADANDEVITMFARSLREWNVEDKDGNPVPTTLSGVNSQESHFVQRLFMGWQVAMAEVDKSLEKTSSSTEITEEASLGLGNVSVPLPSGLKAS